MISSFPRIQEILIATTNEGKAYEIIELLHGCAKDFIRLNDLTQAPEPVENGESFRANASIKARYYASFSAMPAVADDSGLMVDALDGAPGVHSARLVGPERSDAERNKKLLDLLSKLPDEAGRKARFICSACFFDPASEIEIIEEGILQGRIGHSPRGESGFGFDPLFIPEGYDQTLAELGVKIKNHISHRKIAFELLKSKIINIEPE